MKVIHVSFNAEEYGIATILLNILKYQKDCYQDLDVAVAFHTEGPCIDKFKNLGIPIYNLNHRTAKDIRALFKFFKIFKDFDIVQLHTYSPWAFIAAKIARKKLIYSFHGAIGTKNRWTDILVKMFYRLVINNYCGKITFASNASLSRYLKVAGSIDEERIEIFPYGIQIENLVPEKSRRSTRKILGIDSKFVVATAARMDSYKRLDRLIKAFSYLPKVNNYELLILGSGDNGYKNYLINQVKEYQLQNQVRFLDYRRDVFDIIASSDLFVLPTTNESFGLSLLEAMALGVPSVAFHDGGGTVDILGDSGIIVRNARELSTVIVKLKTDNSFKESVAEKVKKRALCFDIKFFADHLIRIYSSLLGKSGK